MSRRLVGASTLLALILGLPGLLDAQVVPKKGGNPGGAIDSDKLNAGTFAGVLKTVPGSDRVFTLTVTNQTLVPNGKAPRINTGRGNGNIQHLLNLENQINQQAMHAQTARSPQQRMQAMQHLQHLVGQYQNALVQVQVAAARANAGSNGIPAGYKLQTNTLNIEFQATEDAKVRTMLLPDQFDEKGNIKKYTDREKADLKGKDKTLPGYESALEKLEAGQKIEVVLKKVVPATKKDKDNPAEAEGEKKMQVRLVVIHSEGTGAAAAGPAPKKKK